MAAVDCPNVVIESIKRAEQDDSMIVRLYETDNARAEVTLSLFQEISGAFQCNMLEEEEKAVMFEGKSVQFAMKPFEIKTIKVKFAK